MAVGRVSDFIHSRALIRDYRPLSLSASTANRIRAKLRAELPSAFAPQTSGTGSVRSAPTFGFSTAGAAQLEAAAEPLYAQRAPTNPEDDERTVRLIREETRRANRNNVTRTEAYLRLYLQHPELHWAFLAHMVSRNGGWSMTDLKGEFCPRLLGTDAAEAVFGMLERCNSLIFQDAYPQLLLYRECKTHGLDLLHLLSAFGVSRFMKPLWSDFLQYADPVPLTLGLIINEQNYIQGRVVENPRFEQSVLNRTFFKAQGILQLNQIVFPYEGLSAKRIGPSHDYMEDGQRLAGFILENFSDLNERIAFGRRLYSVLFGVPRIYEGVKRFAEAVPHSGSRADYWPRVFAAIRKTPPSGRLTERLSGCGLRRGAAPLYSPVLTDAWRDRRVEPTMRYDWFRDLSPLKHFRSDGPPGTIDITCEHGFGLKKMELAALAGQLLE